ncbi:uncharacterized protein LOC116777111 isoform X1 [Danaus plexippus]|uniref:uncharacterized protein LOC116777111 isoform X1 n=1 Tax=Danaus plexippus TaxID=13037 RepID=UPI002AB207B5|nr:uncharacterized protein LOC116777111 isoform X1 [Danaus plexippus]
MPDSRGKPANDCSASDEASRLDLYLQRQLEEDVARIFDESIYSDLEVVCGKLKILTHTCILKARTNKFYKKLEAILHVNIGRDTFDEIYSFISDAYTECDIQNQEKEILFFLKRTHFAKNNLFDSNKIKEEIEDIDVFLTPNSSPCPEQKIQQISCLSPSTELTREYYALVPIDGNLLDQELIEQDALSNAFHTIIKGQDKDSNKVTQLNKPTSLPLVSSHTPKTIKHSINCDIYNKLVHEHEKLGNEREVNKKTNNNYICQKINNTNRFDTKSNQISSSESVLSEKYFDPSYSPDSLITDDPSSSSDYLSAAYACSPAVSTSGCVRQAHVEDYISKMENIFTSSDSGLENTGMLESLSSHKDVTLTDLSLTESTLHDLITDETNNSNGSLSSSTSDKNQICKMKSSTPRTDIASYASTSDEWNGQRANVQNKPLDCVHSNSSKEEKQRQNEEIVILESSSVSSETGSWESVFPPRMVEKEICEKFINTERHHNKQDVMWRRNNPTSLAVIKHIDISLKSTPCFIDAASLADEDQSIELKKSDQNESANLSSDHTPTPSQPVPCSKVNKLDHSPGDWSESNENEDSLEQGDNKDADSIQKDLSPTIFEMTPIAEDSLISNIFDRSTEAKMDRETYDANAISACETEKATSLSASTVYMGTTPHNSILSLKTSSIKNYDSEESENDTIHISKESLINFRQTRYNESSPIVSGGASIEDVRSPKLNQQSPLIRRKIENTPIVTGACYPNVDDSKENAVPKTPKPVHASAWVVDMASDFNATESSINTSNSSLNSKKSNDKVHDNLKSESKANSSESSNKSRCSVDSDSSEKSGHKFYIDLSSLPDPLPPEKPNVIDNNSEKKNIFSMFIDLGEKSTLKEMPSRLSSSLNSQKQSHDSNHKTSSKTCKNQKTVNNLKTLDATPKSLDPSISTTTFERYESLCNDPNISISEIIAIPEAPCLKENEEVTEMVNLKNDKHSRRINGDKTFNTYVIHEEPVNEPSDLFVKLSDLDKPLQKSDIFEKNCFESRMTRSIPDNKWSQQTLGGSSRSSEVISSFHSENALSLNRLFPHLKNEFSRSMPISLSTRTRSPSRPTALSVGEMDDQVSDVSEMSSVQSSICRSVVENSTTEETSQTSSLIGNCQSRLGQDLLRMFLEEIAPDVIVEVSGKRIKAHKCILSSRCQYFAGILSGGWVESAGNVIVLPPFSFNVVHFALCHIYSGLSTIPDSISIVELATIADMLGLEGLKEAIMFTLKSKYCHHFHRPCQVCTAGVLECFPLSSVYGLDDLYRKCLRWITKYFSKVWPTKAFATLPKELLDKCYHEHVVNLSLENFIDTVYGCGTTVSSLQNSRWAEGVARMCRRLVNAAAHFAAPRLPAVLELISVAPEAPQTAKQALDDCLAAAIEWAPPDETCRAYAYLSNLVKQIRNQHLAKPDLISNGNQIKVPETTNLLYIHASSWRLQCEVALVRAAPRVVGTQAFKDLPSDLRKRLRELGCIMYGPQAIPLTTSPLQDRKCKSTYHSKPTKIINPSATRSLDMEKVRNSFVPYKPKPITMTGSKDNIKSNSELRELKKQNKTTVPKVRTTKAQEERAKFNQSKTITTSQERSVTKPATTRVHPFENTKPRYLQPRVKDTEKKLPPKKLVNKIVSSSESSRNSSPIQARNLRPRVQPSDRTHMSQDSLATSSRPRTAEPSTDSLSESQNSNKYATYTKTKHNKQGSVESIISAKCQGVSPSSLLNSAVRTKIPVFLNQHASAANKRTSPTKTSRPNSASVVQATKDKRRTQDRKLSGSLMNATKSSSAKMVPKISKEIHTQPTKSKHSKPVKHPNRSDEQQRTEIPLMERSGTFLKDEPTFGDKTTDIDIDY